MLNRTRFHTVKTLADMLCVKPRIVYRMVKAGQITGHRIGRQWRFSPENVESFLETIVIKPPESDHEESQ